MKVRQGDMLLARVDGLPEDAKRSDEEGPFVVLARGEATGHAHVVPAEDVELFWGRGGRHLRVLRETRLTHPEHAAIELPPGTYRIVYQREFTPRAAVWVRD